MRLTHSCEYKDKRKNREPLTKIRNKLFDLENIEDELGIELRIIGKLLLQEDAYVKDVGYVKITVDKDGISFVSGPGQYTFIPFKNYGKTFALTKEELE